MPDIKIFLTENGEEEKINYLNGSSFESREKNEGNNSTKGKHHRDIE